MDNVSHPALERLQGAFPEDGIEGEEFRGQWCLRVPRERVLDTLRTLRDESDLAFEFLNDVTASDHPDDEERFRVVWILTALSRAETIRVQSTCPEDDPVVPSATPLWATANWLERECFDMFGVRFDGHPDLRRIMMPEGFDAFPLRKEFPMEGERSDRDWGRWVIERAQRDEGEVR